jgi:hypothetical protein
MLRELLMEGVLVGENRLRAAFAFEGNENYTVEHSATP